VERLACKVSAPARSHQWGRNIRRQMDYWRRRVSCLFGLTIPGVPERPAMPSYDQAELVYTCPTDHPRAVDFRSRASSAVCVEQRQLVGRFCETVLDGRHMTGCYSSWSGLISGLRQHDLWGFTCGSGTSRWASFRESIHMHPAIRARPEGDEHVMTTHQQCPCNPSRPSTA